MFLSPWLANLTSFLLMHRPSSSRLWESLAMSATEFSSLQLAACGGAACLLALVLRIRSMRYGEAQRLVPHDLPDNAPVHLLVHVCFLSGCLLCRLSSGLHCLAWGWPSCCPVFRPSLQSCIQPSRGAALLASCSPYQHWVSPIKPAQHALFILSAAPDI